MTPERVDNSDAPAPEETSPPPSRWSGDDWLALGSITAIAAVMRLYHLTIPNSLVFDEAHYARYGCWFTYASTKICNLDGAPTLVHPPLGNEMIASGIQVFGYDPFGWRIVAVLAGVVTVVLTYLLGRRLFGSTLGAVLAAGLLAFDPLHFVQSRTAMLDVFIPLFATASFLGIVYYRDRLVAQLEPSGIAGAERAPPRFKRSWLWFAGIAGGCATAVKWSGGMAVAGVFVVAVAWGISLRRNGGSVRAAIKRFLREDGLAVVLLLGLLPIVTYIVIYLYRIDGGFFMVPWHQGSWYYSFVHEHRFMAGFHFGLPSHHPWESPPWSWWLLKRPVAYFFENTVTTTTNNVTGESTSATGYREIIAMGNPFVWWPSLLAVGYLAWSWVRTRVATRPEGLILAGWAFTYLPWVLLSRGRPSVFLFYILPTLPFMALALAYVAVRIKNALTGKIAIAAFTAIAIGSFFFYYPLLTAVPVSDSGWHQRLLFEDCDPPPGQEVSPTDRKGKRKLEEEGQRPPPGWCWI